jgi:hypothetical protein
VAFLGRLEAQRDGNIKDSRGIFTPKILQIQQFAALGERFQTWAQNLRLLTVIEQPNPGENGISWKDNE